MTSLIQRLASWFTWVRPWMWPLVWVVLAMAGAAALLFCAGLVLRLAAPKMAAIARTAAKEVFSQPLFYVLLGIGAFLLLASPFIPYNTFGEDIKMLKDAGLTVIMVLSIALGVWTASVSIADEIEGRTALTLLCKPVGRWQFIIGKFLGVLVPVAVVFIVLGGLFLATVSYKVVYDARENVMPDPSWRQCAEEVWQIMPGLVLAFFEATVMVSIAVAVSTRLPMIPNLVICAAIYALGHLLPALAHSAAGKLAVVPFAAMFLSTVLPVLDHFNIYAAIATGKQVPMSYVGWAGVYCLLYSMVALLVALLLFEDRELA